MRRPGEILLALAFRPEIEEAGWDPVISKRQQSAFEELDLHLCRRRIETVLIPITFSISRRAGLIVAEAALTSVALGSPLGLADFTPNHRIDDAGVLRRELVSGVQESELTGFFIALELE